MGKSYFLKMTAIVFCGLSMLFSSCKKDEVHDQELVENQLIARDIEFQMQVDGEEWKAKSAEYNILGVQGFHGEDGEERGIVSFRIAAFNKKVDRQEQPINDSALEKLQIDFNIPYVGNPYSKSDFGKGDIILGDEDVSEYQEKDYKLFVNNPEVDSSPGKLTITKLVLIDPIQDSDNYDSSRIEGTFDLELYPEDSSTGTTPKKLTGKFSLKMGNWNLAE